MKILHLVYRIIWYTSIILIVIELIIGATSLSFIIFEIENALIFRLNIITIPIICILFLFLIFFYPTFYRNKKNPKFTFISRHEMIKGTNFRSQFWIDFLFGSLFVYLILFFLSFLINYGILDSEKVRFGTLGLSIIFLDITIINIKYYKLGLKFFSFFVLYSSVLAVIVVPMLIFIGIPFFVFYYYDVSWFFADPTILLDVFISSHVRDMRTIWLNTYLHCSFVYSEAFLITKTIIFLVGLVLFAVSIAQLVYWLKKEKKIVRQGIYKYIRHPQNLAIIIMIFPFFIFYGVRIGDIVTWVQFIFLMIIYSDFEDLRLNKKYPYEFQNYYKNSGFVLPKFVSLKFLDSLSIFNNKKLRYIILFLIYILTIIILYAFYLILPFYHLTF
ncbi:hypothetical protein ES705_09668 [subsurface metagenome]